MFIKMWGSYYMNTPHPRLPSPDIIDVLLRTRAAMHIAIVAAAVWQFEATQNRFLYSLIIISIFLACYHVAKNEKNCAFVGPLFGRHAEHA